MHWNQFGKKKKRVQKEKRYQRKEKVDRKRNRAVIQSVEVRSVAIAVLVEVEAVHEICDLVLVQ